MIITEKVNCSRTTLKDILSDEWNTETIQDYSLSEIDVIYNTPSASLLSSGYASACNFSVSHKMVPSHKLHVIYFQFPEIGKASSKVTRSLCDKVHKLYNNEDINYEDSVFVLINETVSESLEHNVNDLNDKLQNEFEERDISDTLLQEMVESDTSLTKKHFRNVRVFDINTFTNNLLKHTLVPKHTVIRSQKQIKEILTDYNCKANQLPIILKNDPIAKILRMVSGDLCSIERKSKKCGSYLFYRICK